MKKIVLFGEIMLRLKSPAKERLFQSSCLEAVFGGSEANVSVSLAILGKNAFYVTALPDNAVGKAAVSALSHWGVNVHALLRQGRMGIYFLEDGACQRPSQVIYDRSDSSFSCAAPEEYRWTSIFEDASWFHVSGVTPALSQNTADCVFAAVEAAGKSGVKISLDLNYRKKLWNYGKTPSEVMSKLAEKADILIANEEDIQKCLGFSLPNSGCNTDNYRQLCADVKKRFPNIEIIAVTLRGSYSADKNSWAAVLSGKKDFYQSEVYSIENIVERVGAGDSFSAGLIYGLTEYNGDEKKALDFAAAASCLKHSIPGDFNLVSKEEIITLMNGNSNGRIQR